MKTIVIVIIYIAASVAFKPEANIGFNHQEFELSPKWEMLHNATAKIRIVVAEGTEKLKEVAVNDNPEVAPLIAEAIDKTTFIYISFMDKIDALIEAKTLTLEIYKEQYEVIGPALYAASEEEGKLIQQLSFEARNRFNQLSQETNITVENQVLTIKAILTADGPSD